MTKTVALVLGDPGGISPELFATLLADPNSARDGAVVGIGDKRLLAQGARSAGVKVDVPFVEEVPKALEVGDIVLMNRENWPYGTDSLGGPSLEGGRSALDNFRHALTLAKSGSFDAIAFTPFCKQANSLALGEYEDEIRFSQSILQQSDPCMEINIVDNIWSGRVTSHVALSEVASLITVDRILDRIRQLDLALKQVEQRSPRVAVAALNPHAGDGGKFGREEIDIIRPAIEAAQREGLAAEGPFPCDTVFVRARRGDFDAVLTMYHDQGQIAMKLLGFERGYTALFGMRVPITTASHGTAYDIAGKGIADSGPMKGALNFAFQLARS